MFPFSLVTSTVQKYALGCTAAVIVALLATVAVQRHQLHALEANSAQLALRVTNDSARLDSTVKVSATNDRLRKALGDSVAMFRRLVVQVAQQSDAVDKALSLERRGKYDLGLTVDSLRTRIASIGAVVSDSGDHIRRAEFDVRQPPYTVHASVDVPHAPDTAHADLRIALDPIPVVVRLSCAAPNAHGIRPASIEAQTPAWASVNFTDVQQSPDLCASPALTHAATRSLVAWKPVVVGVGYVARDQKNRGVGAFIGTGVAFFSKE